MPSTTIEKQNEKPVTRTISLVNADSKDKKYQLLYVNNDLIAFEGVPHNSHQDSLSGSR